MKIDFEEEKLIKIGMKIWKNQFGKKSPKILLKCNNAFFYFI